MRAYHCSDVHRPNSVTANKVTVHLICGSTGPRVAALEETNLIYVITTQNVTTICLSQVTLLIFKQQRENSHLKIMA